MSKRSQAASQKKYLHGKKQKSQRLEKRLFYNHYKAGFDAHKQVLQTPVSSLITCTVMAMTILLTTSLLMVLKSFGQITHSIHNSSAITVYLKSSLEPNMAPVWIEELRQNPIIRDITYISPEQALKELAESMDYQNLLSEIGENPLPPVILIKLNTHKDEALTSLVSQLKTSTLVSTVNVDYAWLKRLATLVKIGNRISYTLTILFAIGIIFIISHAIQGATERNYQEMKILLLMGANTAYLRRPFLYLGSFLGVGAGVITLFLLILLFLPLKQPLAEIMNMYQLTDSSSFFNISLIIKVFTISVFLGWFGAWWAFYRYARPHPLI